MTYTDYRNSGIPWIGRVPSHWTVSGVGQIGRVQGGKALAARAPGVQRPYLRVANVFDGRIDAEDLATMPFTDAEFTRYQLHPDDILLNEGQSLELVGRAARYTGTPSPCAFQNSLIRVQAGPQSAPGYLERLFRHCQSSGIFSMIATQTTSIAHLGVSRLARLQLCTPPLEEQIAIARFLEEKEHDIEHYLATKRRIIQEYNERETALASSRFDDLISGFSFVRLKDVCEITSGYSFESSGFVSDADGVRLIRGANVGIGRLRWTDENTVRWPAESVPAVARWSLQAGDLVIGLNRPWIDGGLRLAEVQPDDLPCLVLQRVARLRARPSVLGQFLSLMLRTPRLLWELEPDFTGVGTPYIDEHRMKRFRIPLPPLSKQQEIVDLHAGETREIGNALRVLEREIAVMEEYRARLIADAVTGQIDVRRAS